MDTKDFILKALEGAQRALTMNTDDLNPDEMKWRPGPEANPIGFILWHQLRVEDMVINTEIQKKPQVYEQGKWPAKMGLPDDPMDNGGRYTAEQVAAFPVPPLDILMQYGESVRQQTVEYINSLGPNGLDVPLEHPFFGKTTTGNFIVLLLSELYQHTGHIGYIRGLCRSLNK